MIRVACFSDGRIRTEVDMGIMKFMPPALRVEYMAKRGIPFTKGYDVKFDKDYNTKSKDYIRYQSVKKNKFCIETDIEQEKGMAVRTQEREQELIETFKKERFSFEEPGIFLNPYGLTPLCAYLFFYTEEECSVRFCVEGKTKEACITDHAKGLCKWHRVPVYGLYPDMENTVFLELINKDDQVVGKNRIHIQTKPLPKSMQDPVQVEKRTETSAMKLIFVAGKSTVYPFAFDEYGDVRYIMTFRPRGYGYFPLANGRFIVMERQALVPTYMIPHSTQMYEMDWLGRVYRTYYVPNGIHHDVCEMTPGGNLLVVSNSQCGHVEDCIAEVNRQNGRIEKFLDLREVLKTAYRDRTNWIHINSLEYDPKTGHVVFSARNLHSILCIDWKTDKLQWILGETNFWNKTPWAYKQLKTPKGMPWHFQQHSVKRIHGDLDGNPDTFHLILFDNHWNLRRKIPAYDQDEKSYVTIYTIDEKRETAKIEKRFGGIKSKITSNGILKLEERRLFYMGGFLAYPEENEGWCGRISEFDYDTEKELNRYQLRYYFFRAFEMKPNMADLASAMDLYEEPCVGYLQPFEVLEEEMTIPEKMVEEAPLACQEERVRLQIEDGNLWVKSRDHLVSRVFMLGDKKNYVKDFREPEQEQDLAAEMEYFLSIPLYSLSEGEYTIAVEFKGELYNTGKKIKIN